MDVTGQIVLALGITLVSACALNVGYLLEHAAVATLPRLDARRPLRTARVLLGSRRWLVGFAMEATGWALFVVALALAPLSLVQATAAGGIGILALLSARITGVPLHAHEWVGVAIAIAGLVLLAISLAGGHGEGTGASYLAIALWLLVSALVAAISIRLLPPVVGRGVAYGVATGVLFAAGDIATKSAVEGGARLVFVPALIAAYGFGTAILQAGFQRGSPLATAGTATLLTNALPIVAAMTIFGEPLPDGWLGAVRIAAFVAVIVGAVFLGQRKHGAPTDGELPETRPGPSPAVQEA